MKKIMFLMAVAGMFFFAACEKNEVWSDLDPKTIDPSAIWQQHDAWRQPGTIDGGLLILTCDNHFGYQQYQGEYRSSCVYRMSGMNRPSVAEQLNGCYSVDSNSHELVAADGTRPGVSLNHVVDTIEVAELEGDPHHTNFASFLTPCHADLIQVCFDTTNHKVVGHYRDEHGNSLIAEGEWWGVQTRIVVVHDTVDRIIRDTVVINRTDTVEVRISDTINRVIYDTVYRYEYDTINDTIIRIVERIDSVVVNITRNTSYLDQHTSWDSVQAISGGCRVWGKNTVTYIVTENGVEVDRGTQPWRHYSDFSISGIAGVNFPTSVNGGVYNVNSTTGNATVGGHTVTATNTGNHISGTVVVNGFNMTSYLTPCEPIAYQWSFNAPNATLAFRDVHGHPAGTYNTTYNSNTPTRHIVSRDTSWNCGSVTSHNVGSNTINHNITRTGVETINYNVAPLTVTNNLSQSGTYVDSYTFSGTINPSLIGTTVPVTFGANGFSFSFGTVLYTVALGPQAFCQLQYGSTVTLTANGPEISWTYNGQIGYDTLDVNWYHPLTGKRVIDAWASYAYQTNTSAPEEWYVLYTEDLATGQRYFEYIPHTTGYITYSATIVTNTVAISSSDTTAIRGQINAGRYGARVYNHNSTTHQWLPGMTHATQNGSSSSNSWTVTFWLTTGQEANHVDLIVGTTDVNSGNSRRGHGNGTYVEADNGRLYY
jgi:hypothetical protein